MTFLIDNYINDYFVPLATSIRLSATLIRGISNILFLYPIRSRAALIHA